MGASRRFAAGLSWLRAGLTREVCPERGYLGSSVSQLQTSRLGSPRSWGRRRVLCLPPPAPPPHSGGCMAAACGDLRWGPLVTPPPGPFLCGGQRGRIWSSFAVVVLLMSDGTSRAGVRRAALAVLPWALPAVFAVHRVDISLVLFLLLPSPPSPTVLNMF